MSFVSLAEAKIHLRATEGTDEDALIGLYINAAEQAAVKAMDRGVYADGTALQTAMTAAPAALTAATVAKEAAVAAAEAITDSTEKVAALQVAETAYMRAQVAYRQAFDGIVVNDQIKAAVLLTVGHLYANREDVVVGASVAALPNGADCLLQPFKVYC
ncbi:MAG: head-tail connector protein [Gammaproteobacteria bacterium]|nr:head-tail connector protein [Gammaproteobacteria bacterium]